MKNFHADASWKNGDAFSTIRLLVASSLVFSMSYTGFAAAREAQSDPVFSPQLRPPVVLTPSSDEEKPAGVAGSLLPKRTEPDPVTDVESGVHIETNMLQAIDPDSVGILDVDQGGFGTEMWSGSNRQTVEWLLPKLPVTTHSRTMQNLMRRLLLSNATAPSGASEGVSLMALRIARLMAMGDTEAVESLLRVAPAHLDDEALLRAQVNNLFLVNDSARACPHIRVAVRKSQDSFWQKGLIFCQALNGENARATLGVNLMREQGVDSDSTFFKLIGSLLAEWKGEIDSLPEPSALQLAIVRAGNLKLPSDVTQSRDSAILTAIAISPNADPETRLTAAEQAESAGALSTDSLRQIYASIKFTPGELKTALTTAETTGGPRGRALLLHAARIQDVPTARAEVLLTFLESARDGDLYETAARVISPILIDMAPATELIWFAEEAGRALIFTGALEQAMDWYDLAERETPGIPEARQVTARLWPLIQLSNPDKPTPLDGATTKAWVKQGAVISMSSDEDSDDTSTETKNADSVAGYREDMLLGLLDSVGKPVDSSVWEDRFQQALSEEEEAQKSASLLDLSLPSPVLWYGLRMAAEELRLGETILFSLVALGSGDLGLVHPITLNEIISRLRLVGLDKEARDLALEAAIAVGL